MMPVTAEALELFLRLAILKLGGELLINVADAEAAEGTTLFIERIDERAIRFTTVRINDDMVGHA
jgi:hypothetical protein